MNDEIKARLSVRGFKSTTKPQRAIIAKWLKGVAKQIEKAKPIEYVNNPRWTLYK